MVNIEHSDQKQKTSTVKLRYIKTTTWSEEKWSIVYSGVVLLLS